VIFFIANLVATCHSTAASLLPDWFTTRVR
jgi:hypothetical protein